MQLNKIWQLIKANKQWSCKNQNCKGSNWWNYSIGWVIVRQRETWGTKVQFFRNYSMHAHEAFFVLSSATKLWSCPSAILYASHLQLPNTLKPNMILKQQDKHPNPLTLQHENSGFKHKKLEKKGCKHWNNILKIFQLSFLFCILL